MRDHIKRKKRRATLKARMWDKVDAELEGMMDEQLGKVLGKLRDTGKWTSAQIDWLSLLVKLVREKAW